MDDTKIVQLYWDRDEQAIRESAEKYGNYCLSIAKNILGVLEDAEECVNDTYLNAWNAMPPQRPKILATFLGKITRNLSFNRYKYTTAEKRGGGALSTVLNELAECVSGMDDVEQAYDYKELVATINEFIGTLTRKKRSIFICRYWYTDSVDEIAARHGMTSGATSMTLRRIRIQLRSFLAERGYDL